MGRKSNTQKARRQLLLPLHPPDTFTPNSLLSGNYLSLVIIYVTRDTDKDFNWRRKEKCPAFVFWREKADEICLAVAQCNLRGRGRLWTGVEVV